MRVFRVIFSMAAAVMAASIMTSTAKAQDPLPSWQDDAPKTAIMSFVASVTKEGSPTYVAPADRIAVFDNDGTLWSEKPYYNQLAFALDRVKVLSAKHPDWHNKEPFASILRNDLKTLLSGDESAIIHRLLEIVRVTHAGMTETKFNETVNDWIQSARHPKTNRLYTQMVYQPMLELLAYLRTNGFKTFIVSGGGVDFMRAWTDKTYGIPPEQVIGSRIKLKFQMRHGIPTVHRLADIDFIDDKEGKPVGIMQHIGRRPIAAFGNSDGDLQMLQWTCLDRAAQTLCLYVHHTDGEREWAYDRHSAVGKLDRGLDAAKVNGWVLVDMKSQWKRVFPEP
ncbi:MAG TPA: HAD family hydrolase [Hyphomicrobiaceae bacterium]|nr:HAD family hydrolase [Hyphomicrobiaceae bacterium]